MLTLVTAEKTRAYGLWRAVIRTPEGGEFEGWGISAWRAEATARAKAREAAQAAEEQRQ
jgi:hypothetical protein